VPVLEVWNARDVIVFKRSMATGYADVQDLLFFARRPRCCSERRRTRWMTSSATWLEIV